MYIMDDGIRLSAVLEMPEPPAQRCPLVILLHGFSSSKDRPHNVSAAGAMRSAGFATLRLDLYGHGESDGEFRNHTLYKWIGNTLAAIDYARSLGFVTDLYLSGHSQGGLVAALTAGIAPDLVKGLILRSPAFMIPRCARDGNMLGHAFDPAAIPDSVPTIKGLDLSGSYIRVAQSVWAEPAMERFPGPVLILHGDDDDTVPLADSEDAAKRYHLCELMVIPGETHHFDRHPDVMCRLICDWLSARSG